MAGMNFRDENQQNQNAKNEKCIAKFALHYTFMLFHFTVRRIVSLMAFIIALYFVFSKTLSKPSKRVNNSVHDCIFNYFCKII